MLDGGKREYVPGDKVKGTVLLNARSDVAAGAIRIVFIGKSKAKLKMSKSEYDSKANLFTFSQTLYEGNYTFSAAKCFEWPFSFTFPRTPARPMENGEFKRTNAWQYTCTCPLPPSLDFEDHSLNSTLTCSVVYRLEAELIKPMDSFSLTSRRFHCVRYVKFSSERHEASPIIDSITSTNFWEVQSYRILPEFQNRSLTMKEKMQSAFGSSKLPVSGFRVTTSLPNQIVQNTELPISIKIEHLPSKSTTDVVPPVNLCEVSVKTTAITTGRGDAAFGRWHNLDAETKYIVAQQKSLDYSLFDEPPGSLVPGATANLNINDVLNLSCNINPPDFLTYNVKRHYILHLKIVLQSADKRHEVRQNMGQFRVHSSHFAAPPPAIETADATLTFFPQPPSESPPPEEGSVEYMSALNDPPPAYKT